MPITHDYRQVHALLSAPYREGETIRVEEVHYATEEDLRAAGWRPATEVGLMGSMVGRQMLEQLWNALGCADNAGTWEEALNTVSRNVVNSKPVCEERKL